LVLAAVQAFSSLGAARHRAVKVAVKTCLAVGMALAIHGILQSPWPRVAQVAALAALLGMASLSTIPRRRRIAAALAASGR
jgi:hypothetical protein